MSGKGRSDAPFHSRAEAGEADRYARQRLIPGWDQDRLASARVVIIGVGALGNEVAKNMALLGVGRVLLCDPDVVSASNLSRTVLFTAADVGVAKVDAAAGALRRLTAAALAVDTRREDLVRGVGLGELADADVVFGCLDSRRARLRLLGRCALVQAPLVDGGTRAWGGEVRLRLGTEQPCFGCTLTAAQRAERDAAVGCDAERPRAPLPASIVPTSLVAGWMTLAATRLILGEPLGWRFLNVDGATGTVGPVVARRDPTCPHHTPAGAVATVSVSAACTAGQLMASLPGGVEPLSWARFPLAGTCNHCGAGYDFHYAPRENGVPCPHCGRGIHLRFSRRLRQVDASTPLRDIGIAAEEILAVRMPEGGYKWVRLSR